MKNKTMIAAIAACALMSTFADGVDDDKAAQVYDVKITIKTTSARTAKLSSTRNPFVSDVDGEKIVYRTQASQKWDGVIWGCNCDAILGKWTTINPELGIVAGCVIWNTKSPYETLFSDDIHWRLLNAIDKNGDKVEGAWTIGDSSDESNAFLSFAGFGTLALSTAKEDGELTIADCMSYIKTLSGNVAGWMPAPCVTTPGKKSVCTFCNTIEEGTDDQTDPAAAWNFCDCAEFGDGGFTAVSGTWSIKYNAKLSKKLRDTTSILNVYNKFPSSVEAEVRAKITETLGDE